VIPPNSTREVLMGYQYAPASKKGAPATGEKRNKEKT
jgi:hypothetical protein